MIRHAAAFVALPLTVLPLPVAMIEPTFRAALMTLVGASPLLSSSSPTARWAAIAMPTVAVRTQEKRRQAVWAQTDPLHQDRFVRRHACPQAHLLDTGTHPCQPRPVCWVSPSRR